jgi:hypothetical protein
LIRTFERVVNGEFIRKDIRKGIAFISSESEFGHFRAQVKDKGMETSPHSNGTHNAQSDPVTAEYQDSLEICKMVTCYLLITLL